MESEKVKEIKKVLEEGQFNTINHHQKEGKPIKISFADILTLINELESENERLSKELDSEWKDRRKVEENLHRTQWNYKIGLGQSRRRNKELKDRIAELEKENGELKEHVTEVEKGIINIAKERNKKDELASKFIDSYNDSLKEFAERLKNKLFEFFQDNEELDGKISVGPLYVDVIGVEAEDGTIISLGLIDKLLKEYEKCDK